MRILIVGCGDTGLRLAQRLQARGDQVIGSTRSAGATARLEANNIVPWAVDLDRPEDYDPPAGPFDCLHYFAPPPRSGEDDPRLAGLLEKLEQNSPARLVYISTSGIYGDCDGAWVDETRAPNPDTPRARRRVAAEARLFKWAQDFDLSLAILRVPGIYGPGRLPIQRLRKGEPILRDADCSWINRIHIDDLVACALAAGEPQAPTGLFNVSDTRPAKLTDFYFPLADQLGLPRPPTMDMEQARERYSKRRLSFLLGSRRLATQRMREVLGIQPRYPDVADGIRASLAEQ